MEEEFRPKTNIFEEVQMEMKVSHEIFQDLNSSEGHCFQVPEKDPDLLSTPGKAPPSATTAAVSPPGQRGQYNSPVGLYSPETLREMMLMQGKLGEGSAAARGGSSVG